MKAKFDKRTRDYLSVSTWNLSAMETLQAGIDDVRAGLDEMVDEYFRVAVAYDAEIRMPYIWSKTEWSETEGELPGSDGCDGPPVTDPLAIKIVLPLGSDEVNGPAWTVSFSDIMLSEIEAVDNGSHIKVSDDIAMLKEWRIELMKLVDAIDASVKRKS